MNTLWEKFIVMGASKINKLYHFNYYNKLKWNQHRLELPTNWHFFHFAYHTLIPIFIDYLLNFVILLISYSFIGYLLSFTILSNFFFQWTILQKVLPIQ